MKILILVLIFMLPFLSFSQQTVNKEPINKSLSTSVAVKKQINPIAIGSQTVPNEQKIDIYSDEYRNSNGVPIDFPHYIDNGNPKLDKANYHDAKQEWIKNNPERFEKIKHLAL